MKTIKITEFITVIVVVGALSLSHLAFAQSYEQKYSEWKAKQQHQDAQLSGSTIVTQESSPQSETKTFNSKIKLNSATADQLQQLSGVGLKKAEAIIEYRNKKGKFKSIEEIQQVKGIGPALFEKNKAKLSL